MTSERRDLQQLTEHVLDALRHPEKYLSAEDFAEYERCKQSIIDARRAGERIARELWIG